MIIKLPDLKKSLCLKIAIALMILSVVNSCKKEESKQQTMKIVSKAIKQNEKTLKVAGSSLIKKPSCSYWVAAIGGLAEGATSNPDYRMVVSQLQNMADMLVSRRFGTQEEARSAAYSFDNEARTYASQYDMTWTPVRPDVPNLITSDCGDLDDPYLPEPGGGGGGDGGTGGSGSAPATRIDLNFLDRGKYPVLSKIVDGLYQKVKTDRKLMDALKNFSKLPEDQILTNLVSGQGPKLTVVNNLPPNVVGRYTDGTNEIRLNEVDARDLNNFSLDRNVSTALEFFFTSLILHEFVHFGNDVSGVQVVSVGNFDAGAQFENAYYRGDVKYDPVTKDIFLVPMPK